MKIEELIDVVEEPDDFYIEIIDASEEQLVFSGTAERLPNKFLSEQISNLRQTDDGTLEIYIELEID